MFFLRSVLNNVKSYHDKTKTLRSCPHYQSCFILKITMNIFLNPVVFWGRTPALYLFLLCSRTLPFSFPQLMMPSAQKKRFMNMLEAPEPTVFKSGGEKINETAPPAIHLQCDGLHSHHRSRSPTAPPVGWHQAPTPPILIPMSLGKQMRTKQIN